MPDIGFVRSEIERLRVQVGRQRREYAEAATGNRDYFLDKPHSIGGSRKKGDIP